MWGSTTWILLLSVVSVWLSLIEGGLSGRLVKKPIAVPFVNLRELDSTPSKPSSSFHTSDESRRSADRSEEEEDEEDDENEWDFMDDSVLLSSSTASDNKPCVASLPAQFVNDNFCDCPEDGSDEPLTAACTYLSNVLETNPLFNCSMGNQRISLSFLNDGICDCCDGSDETGTGTLKCPNTCDSFQETKEKKLLEELKMTQRALEIRQEYIKKAPFRLKGFTNSYEESSALLQRLQQYFQQRQQAIQASAQGEQPTQKDIQELQSIYHHLNQINYLTYVAKRVHESSYGEQGEFAALVGQCFDFLVNEKQLKGGSSNVIPREYVMVFCPFQNITQTEPSYAKWKRLEHESKHQTNKQKVNDDEEDDTTEQQPPIMLGIWNRWINQNQEEEEEPLLLDQYYDQGDQCINKQHRIVHVEFFCGDTNQVLNMNENEMCVYSLDFQTPAACKPFYIKEIQKEIDLLHHQTSHISSSSSSAGNRGHEEL